MATASNRLHPLQIHFLRFFNEKTINEQETVEIQKLVAHYYAEKADKMMDEIWQKKQMNDVAIRELLEKDLTKK